MTADFTWKSSGCNILQPGICQVVSVWKFNDEVSFVLIPPDGTKNQSTKRHTQSKIIISGWRLAPLCRTQVTCTGCECGFWSIICSSSQCWQADKLVRVSRRLETTGKGKQPVQYQQLGLMEGRNYVAAKPLPKPFGQTPMQEFQPFKGLSFSNPESDPRVCVKGPADGTNQCGTLTLFFLYIGSWDSYNSRVILFKSRRLVSLSGDFKSLAPLLMPTMSFTQ